MSECSTELDQQPDQNKDSESGAGLAHNFYHSLIRTLDKIGVESWADLDWNSDSED